MKLDNYTISKMQDQIAQFLFIKWLEGGLWDSNHPEIKELYENYHNIMIKQIEIVEQAKGVQMKKYEIYGWLLWTIIIANSITIIINVFKLIKGN